MRTCLDFATRVEVLIEHADCLDARREERHAYRTVCITPLSPGASLAGGPADELVGRVVGYLALAGAVARFFAPGAAALALLAAPRAVLADGAPRFNV